MLKRILAALAAIGILGLGLSAIGPKPIAPGYDTGFDWKIVGASKPLEVRLVIDAGDLDVLLDLVIRCRGDSVRAWRARLENGMVLSVSEQALVAGALHLRIAKMDPVSLNEKFLWPSGVALLLSNAAADQFTIEDWHIYPKEKRHDSKGRAWCRKMWFLTSLVFLLFGVVGTVVQKLAPEREPFDLTAQINLIVRQTISSVDGKDSQETKRIRKLLTKVVLESAPSAEVLDSLLPADESYAKKKQLWFKAANGFTNRLETIMDRLRFYSDLLEEPKLVDLQPGEDSPPS